MASLGHSVDNSVETFNKAAAHLTSIASKLNSSDLLQFYALYKQSIEGPCTTPRPNYFDFKGKQKWEAWKSLQNMLKEEAMMGYIAKLYQVDPSWSENPGTKIGWISVSRMLPEDISTSDDTIFSYVKENDIEKLKRLSHSTLISCDEAKMTPLHWACDRGHKAIVEYLLSQRVDYNSQDEDGQTPMHYAASCGHEDVVKLLLTFGARKDIRDNEGIVPIECAEDESIKLLLQ